MNDASNGSLVRTGLVVGVIGGFAATMAACPGPAPHFANGGNGGTGGNGGNGGATSTSTSGSTTPTPGTCTAPSDCPPLDVPCRVATCEGNLCGAAAAPKGTSCTAADGALCDDAGQCVECLEPKDCTHLPSGTCSGNLYQAPPKCVAGTCAPGDILDCATNNQKKTKCKAGIGCVECLIEEDCPATPNTSCTTFACNSTVCEPLNKAVTTPCKPPGDGVCNAEGACIAAWYVFVTKAVYAPNFGGVLQADQQCQTDAEAAGLKGKWMSWTSESHSTSPVPAPSSPSTRFTPSTVPYLMLDGTKVASNWTELSSGALLNGIDLDEHGQPLSGVDVWTGTKPSGQFAQFSCGDWTSTTSVTTTADFGVSGAADGAWSYQGLTTPPKPCIGMAHLYCFQQPQP